MTLIRQLLPLGIVIGASLAFSSGCGDDGGTGAGGNNTGGGSTGNSGVCILHNCRDNSHCEGCSEGRTTCRIESGEEYGRCVACGADGTGCPEGQECSSFGDCVPIGLTCATDGMGVPQISCNNSGD